MTRRVTIATYDFESTWIDRQGYFAPDDNLLKVCPTPGRLDLGSGALDHRRSDNVRISSPLLWRSA
jgi:hypothetical protein